MIYFPGYVHNLLSHCLSLREKNRFVIYWSLLPSLWLLDPLFPLFTIPSSKERKIGETRVRILRDFHNPEIFHSICITFMLQSFQFMKMILSILISDFFYIILLESAHKPSALFSVRSFSTFGYFWVNSLFRCSFCCEFSCFLTGASGMERENDRKRRKVSGKGGKKKKKRKWNCYEDCWIERYTSYDAEKRTP